MYKLKLMKTANEVRKSIVTAVHSAKAGHPGGSLSAADIFTYLYFEEMNIDPADPKKADRDRFVLSKGHTGHLCCSGNGTGCKTDRRRLQSVHTAWRRRDPGRTGMGGFHAGSTPQAGQSCCNR